MKKDKDTGLGLIVGTSVAICVLAGFSIYKVFDETSSHFGSLATLILVGLAAFIGLMNALSLSAKLLGIIDRKQPFGLPEGTVRAILTISFIVLVGVLASFLLTNTGARQSFAERPILIANIPIADANALRDKLSNDGLVVVVPGTGGNPAMADVRFFGRQDYRLADDVAKQILTMLSTILAAMIGFYFGARPGEGGGPGNGDGTARAALLSELNVAASQGPAAEAVAKSADDRPTPVTDADRDLLAKAKQDISDVQKKVAAARSLIGDLSASIETVRAAQADALGALAKLPEIAKRIEGI